MIEPNPTTPAPYDQNAQARLVLIQLQWLIIILLVSAMLWLGNNQSKLVQSVNDRLKVAQALDARINDLDDRLFATTNIAQTPITNRNADNDWQLIGIQMNAIHRFYEKGDYATTSELLQGVAWQLSYEQLHVATPLKNALKQAIAEDLASLATLQSKPDAWQLHAIKMQEIQRYLRTQMSVDNQLDKSEFALNTAHTMLTMAISASSLHEKSTISHYLTETLHQLEWLEKYSPATASSSPVTAGEFIDPNKIQTLNEAIFAVNQLLANPPNLPPLSSIQIAKR